MLIKSDGGPGRTHEEYLSQSNLDGLVHYHGLPNSTFFQELDQVFAYLKTMMEDNRKRIWDVKFDIDGHNAKIRIGDFAKILFGGEYTFSTGAFIILTNAFAEGLNKEHLDSAMKTCGYVPATREALKSRKLRHEIVTNIDGELDQELNDLSMTDTLIELEKINHNAIKELEEKGYKLASTLKQTVCRRQNSNVSGSTSTVHNPITIPGTSEHHRALSLATTQGKHFQATNGGAPMKSNDMMCAAEIKAWEKEKVELQKKKKLVKKQQKLQKDASKALGNIPVKWSLITLKAKIISKDPSLKAKLFCCDEKG